MNATATIVIVQDHANERVYHSRIYGNQIRFSVTDGFISVWHDEHPVDTIVLRPDDKPGDRMVDWIDTAFPF